jgi:hypothetical protein
MAKHAISKRPRFNPSEYKEEFLDLAKTNPELAAESATKLARRKRNADDELADADATTTGLVAGLGSFAIMALVGAWQGSLRAKRAAIIAHWEEEGAAIEGVDPRTTPTPFTHPNGVSDPTMLWMFPKILLPPVALAVAAGIAAVARGKKKQAGAFERIFTMSAIATGGLAIADIVGTWAFNRKEQKLAAGNDVRSVKAA